MVDARLHDAVLPDFIAAGSCRLRGLVLGDAEALATLANDPTIARWVRDRFPSPYTLADARRFLVAVHTGAMGHVYGIEVDGALAGTASLMPREDVERLTVEIGFWLGARFRGRGVATAAVAALTELAFGRLALARVEAHVFSGNHASARVLEKAGFEREGVRRAAILKDGIVCDSLLYARISSRYR
jgi:[ribosomal protein S5]-alanine N-acetyltransferase